MNKNTETNNSIIKVPGADHIHTLIMGLTFNEIHDKEIIKARSRAKHKNIERPCDIEDFERMNIIGEILVWIINFCDIIIRGRLNNDDVECVKQLIFDRFYMGTAMINYRFDEQSYNAGSLIRFIKQVARYSIADFYGSISGKKKYITEEEYENYEYENIRFDDPKGAYVYKNTPTKKDIATNPLFISLDVITERIIQDNNYSSDSFDDIDYYDTQDNTNCNFCEDEVDYDYAHNPGCEHKKMDTIEYYRKIISTIFSYNIGTLDIKVSYFYNLLNKLEKQQEVKTKQMELENIQAQFEKSRTSLDENEIKYNEDLIIQKKEEIAELINQTKLIKKDFSSTYNLKEINNYIYKDLRLHMINSLKVLFNKIITEETTLSNEIFDGIFKDFDKSVEKKYHGIPSNYVYSFDENNSTFITSYSRFNKRIQMKIQEEYGIYISKNTTK